MSSTTASTTTASAKSSSVASKAPAAANISVGSHLSLNQATRAHVQARKRKVQALPKALTGVFSTCNSGFLSSLLADVRKAKEEIIRAKQAQGNEDFQLVSPSVKRRRISMPDADATDADATDADATDAQINKPFFLKEPSNFLDLLWGESWLAAPVVVNQLEAAVAPVPPRANIPATVSDSFEGLEEDALEDIQKNPASKEHGFGWFVDMDEDDNDDSSVSDDSHRSYIPHSKSSLAFSAPTAPKASNYDAEIEWAKAADTVDDVLGDLF